MPLPRDAAAPTTPLASIRRYMRPRAKAKAERCGLCTLELEDEHPHLVELATRKLVCACDACAVLFDDPNATRYRRTPRRVRALTDFRVTDEAWEGLQLPINLAFFVRNTADGRLVALYPSPGGATESAVADEAWEVLVRENPVLAHFEPDVEGLLVNRVGESRGYYRVGIDECYRLVGLIRSQWHGISGGPAVWEAVTGFFADLDRRA